MCNYFLYFQSIVKDFASNSERILKEAMKFAPNWTKSHIQEYVDKIPSVTHAGLALALESVLNYCPNNAMNASLSNTVLDKRPKCVKTDSSKFATVLNLRAKHLGEVKIKFLKRRCTFRVLFFLGFRHDSSFWGNRHN